MAIHTGCVRMLSGPHGCTVAAIYIASLRWHATHLYGDRFSRAVLISEEKQKHGS